MPFIQINDAQIHYEVYGEDQPGKAPILLIHGSTVTGQADWSLAAPLLARSFRVIVHDCRGHGRSSNPRRSYSFKELATDSAALVQALGYGRAHVIGHSNGGNVALVTLLEHPEVVQTAVVQAANAYVSQDLIDKEPRIFDPDRVAKENPAWMNEMITLHGPTHGEDYWRELLLLTVKEIISEPNYTPRDLTRVSRPTLVIQGENDRVNAPSRHAQFIARHIPDAELWIPAGVGHNVHLEQPCEWVDRVMDFLERRGDEANDALHRLRSHQYADERETIFSVRATPAGSDSGRESLKISGGVLQPEQVAALKTHLQNTSGLPLQIDTGEVRVYLNEDTPWALVNRSVIDVRRQPSSLAERLTQVLLGERLRILEVQDEWAFVRLEGDGYLGWVQRAGLLECSSQTANEYPLSCNVVVIVPLADGRYTADDDTSAGISGKLPFGVRLPVIQQRDEQAAVRLPDGREWWVAGSDLLPLAQQPKSDTPGIHYTLERIRRFTGVPYLWGGRTPFGFDCSGLAQTFAGFLGVQVPRDADRQSHAAAPVTGTPQPGDLLFFGTGEEDARRPITHMAISLGGDEVIHANGAAGGISYNSLDPNSSIYRAWLRENLVGVGRFWL